MIPHKSMAIFSSPGFQWRMAPPSVSPQVEVKGIGHHWVGTPGDFPVPPEREDLRVRFQPCLDEDPLTGSAENQLR